jgi:hypothetical protein
LDRFAIGALLVAAGLLAASLYINVGLYEAAQVEHAQAPATQPAVRNEAEQQAPSTSSDMARAPTAREEPSGSPAASAERSNPRSDSVSPPSADAPRTQRPITTQSKGDLAGRSEQGLAADASRVSPDGETNTVAPEQPSDPQGQEPETSAADMAPMETAEEPVEAVSSPNIARAQFTTGIDEREPVDRIGPIVSTNGQAVKTLYYFTEIVNMSGATVIHRWEHEGEVIAEVSFEIGSDSWRTWSSKDLTRASEGEWRVTVIDADGHVLKTASFVYTDA